VTHRSDARRDARIGRVLAATSALLAAHGLGAVTPRVVSASANVVLALDGLPSGVRPLVVRSPSRTDLLAGQDPADPRRLRQEVALAGWLAAAGAPVVPPAGPGCGDVLPAGPHAVDGVSLTVWRAGAVPAPGTVTASDVGAGLRALHAAAGGYPDAAALPPLGPVAGDLDLVLATTASTGEVAPGLLRRLRAARDAVSGPLLDADRTSWQAVHGDAHPRNVLVMAGRLVWNDLEDACLAPVAWDLGTLRSTSVLDGAAAVGAYGADAAGRAWDDARLAPWVRARELQRVLWRAVRARTAQDVGEVHAMLDTLVPGRGPH
jgi:Ser/Thr protein kinase RdoA (MazF antagonist)